jgi:hypothetical protein
MTFTDWLNRWRVPVNATFTVWRPINSDGFDYMSNNQIANHAAPCSRSVTSTCCCLQYDFRTKQLKESRNGKFYKITPPLPFLHPFRLREVVANISWRPPETHNVTVQAPSLSYIHGAPEFFKARFPCYFLCSQTLANTRQTRLLIFYTTNASVGTMQSINR